MKTINSKQQVSNLLAATDYKKTVTSSSTQVTGNQNKNNIKIW